MWDVMTYENGHCVKSVDKAYKRITHYTHDEMGAITKSETYEKDGALFETLIYAKTFDKHGNLIKSAYFDKDGKETWAVVYVYNKKGNCIKERQFLDTELTWIYEYQYCYF